MAEKPPGEGSVSRMEFLLKLRRRGIGDADVLRAMDEVPREHFVSPQHADTAYADQALPIACGQTISQPYLVAYMTAALGVKPHHRVLEIGTGTGYQTAVLSRLAREVYSVERFRTLAEAARVRLETLDFSNAHVVVGDGMQGLPAHAPYERIMVTAAAEQVPQALLAQLAEGGVMVLPLGPHDGVQELIRLTKRADGVVRETLIGVRFVPLLPGPAREL